VIARPHDRHNFREVVASRVAGDHNFPEVVTIMGYLGVVTIRGQFLGNGYRAFFGGALATTLDG
jgi:hypothetical protein